MGFLNRKTAPSSERAQDAADYKAQQEKQDREGRRDDANVRGKTQPADGRYNAGTRWGGWT